MIALPQSMQKLIRELMKLPSVGEKSATRLAYFLLNNHLDVARSLAGALITASDGLKLCEECFFYSDSQHCPICTNTSRDRSLLCVVEKPTDLIALEKMGEFRGVYHVLHGLWAPLRGQDISQLKLKELIERVKKGEIKEIIFATSCTVEGDATALYISQNLAALNVTCTRLAQGMPKGGELEYSDDFTLSRAMAGRQRM